MEPTASSSTSAQLALPPNLLEHALLMLVCGILFYVAQIVLWACALLQLLWMLFSRQRNAVLAELGRGLANWMATAARFLTGASDLKPFPWSSWG
jgi:Domain of unknown function (DUF4389)